MQMKFEQSQKQTNTMTQKLIQNVEVLQMSSQELMDYICEQATENPVIDMDALSSSEMQNKLDWLRSNERRDHAPAQTDDDGFDARDRTCGHSYGSSLKESLLIQLSALGIDSTENEICRYLIACVDSRGYLNEDRDSVAEAFGASPETVQRCMDLLRSFSPPGVCAAGLKECLAAQIALHPENKLAAQIIEHHLDSVARGHYAHIAKALGTSVDEVRAAAERISQLSPNPSAGFEDRDNIYYTLPDAQIRVEHGNLKVSLFQSYTPSLKISSYYENLFRNTDDEGVKEYLLNKLNSAQWLIKCVSQREETLLNCIEAIAEIQSVYFLGTSSVLAPMTLGDVAERMGVHKSTVSRTIRGKFIQCSAGVLPAKSFFVQKLGRKSSKGDSSDMARSMILQLVSNEDKRAPLSDQKICELMAKNGVDISRRTVAKYREALGIPGTFIRKVSG